MNSLTDPAFVADLIIRIMTEDPTKVIDCIEGAEGMVIVAFGASRHELMAEEAIHLVRTMNPHLPHLSDTLAQHNDLIERRLIAHFEQEGW